MHFLPGDSPSAEKDLGRLQGKMLASDMSAFKDANPGAVLGDFIRWHSPRDWLSDPSHPLGGQISDRIVSFHAGLGYLS